MPSTTCSRHGTRRTAAIPLGCPPRTEALLAGEIIHPMLRALWAPRLSRRSNGSPASEADRAEGREPVVAEEQGEAEVAGVTLYGRVDRLDPAADGRLAVVDYKSGKAPSGKAVAEGFAFQLGLLALIAERGGFGGIKGPTGADEYWSLTKDKDRFGKRVCADKDLARGAFVADCAAASHRRGANISPATSRSRPSSIPSMHPTRITTS